MIKALEWDSAFFGFPVGELEPDLPVEVGEVDRFLASGEPSLVQALVPVADVLRIAELEEAGFRLVDIRISFRFTVGRRGAAASDIRRATPDDIPEIRRLAAGLFSESRYFCDPFPRERSRMLFAAWAEKAVLGTFDHACLVATGTEGIAGFVTTRAGEVGRIGLVGVHPQMQGRGIASALVDAALAWSAAEGESALDVSTQSRNLRAQNLYIAKGARLKDVDLWFYRTGRVSSRNAPPCGLV
jgi:dTDP-4-amino-4,6-dideoxy-D-galactose acyltransferase